MQAYDSGGRLASRRAPCGFLLGWGARVPAFGISVGTLLVTLRAAAQSAEPPSAAPHADRSQASAGERGAEMPHDLLVTPIGGVGHGNRKRRVVSRSDYRPVWVNLHVPGRSFAVVGDAESEVAICSESCQFWVYAGNYDVRVGAIPGEVSQTIRIHVRRPGDYTVVLGNSTARDAGLALGVTGATTVFIGGIVTFAGLLSYDCTHSTSSSDADACRMPPAFYYGLGTMGAGALMSAVGFILLGSNTSSFRYKDASVLARTRIDVVSVPRGAALSTSISF